VEQRVLGVSESVHNRIGALQKADIKRRASALELKTKGGHL
jgi:hypothetical protein